MTSKTINFYFNLDFGLKIIFNKIFDKDIEEPSADTIIKNANFCGRWSYKHILQKDDIVENTRVEKLESKLVIFTASPADKKNTGKRIMLISGEKSLMLELVTPEYSSEYKYLQNIPDDSFYNIMLQIAYIAVLNKIVVYKKKGLPKESDFRANRCYFDKSVFRVNLSMPTFCTKTHVIENIINKYEFAEKEKFANMILSGDLSSIHKNTAVTNLVQMQTDITKLRKLLSFPGVLMYNLYDEYYIIYDKICTFTVDLKTDADHLIITKYDKGSSSSFIFQKILSVFPGRVVETFDSVRKWANQ